MENGIIWIILYTIILPCYIDMLSDAGRHLTEPPTTRLISGLQAGSRVFARYWSEQDVRQREGGARTFRSSTGAMSTYSQISLIPATNTDLKLVALIPQLALSS